MHRPLATRLGLAAGTLTMVLVPIAALAGDGATAPVDTTPHFALYSDLATNLHDALLVAGSARNDGEPEVFQPGAEGAACFAELPASEQAGWDLAVEYHARIVSPARWTDRQQFLLRVDLAGFDEELDQSARRLAGIAQGFRMAALPAYEACRWSVQDAANRRWIDELAPRLAAHEAAIAERLARLYQTPWHGIPIRVDVVAHSPEQGASSLYSPPHILVSSSIGETDALEIVHHEASHTLMARGDPIRKELAVAARKLEVKLPRDLWHVILFYTTGDTVRQVLADAGEGDYTPFVSAHDLWSGSWGRYRKAIDSTWPAYLRGERSLSEACSDLLRALADQDR